MRVQTIALAGLLTVLTACTGVRTDDYAGQPIERVARDLGYPSRIVELPDGRRSYSWDITRTTETGPIRPVLRGVSIGVGSGGRSGVGVGIGMERESTLTTQCTYTLTAAPSGETYVVEAGTVGNPACLS